VLQVGEKVRYLDDVGEATIIKIVDSKTVIVEDEYGLTHPHPISKLVPAERDHVVPKAIEKKPAVTAPQAKPISTDTAASKTQLPELALVFVSSNESRPESGDLDLFFANRSSYRVMINVAAKVNEEWFSLYHGEVLPNSDRSVHSLRRQDVGSVSNLNVDLIFFGNAGYEYRKPISCTVKVKATKFVKHGNYQRHDGFENPAIAFELQNEITSVAMAVPRAAQRARTTIPTPRPLIFEEEVDLHLEAILGEDPIGMPDHEKFLTQMRHFERKLTHALTHNYLEITFIHGVGTGRLKEAIRQELKEYGLPFQDGPFHKYGVGATVVNLNLV
jgi:hypothetical protein